MRARQTDGFGSPRLVAMGDAASLPLPLQPAAPQLDLQEGGHRAAVLSDDGVSSALGGQQ